MWAFSVPSMSCLATDCRSSAVTSRPTRKRLFFWMRITAMLPAAGLADPESGCVKTPANASTMSASTGPSSATSALMVGSELFNTWPRTVRCSFRASAWAWRDARAKAVPSSRNGTARNHAGDGRVRSRFRGKELLDTVHDGYGSTGHGQTKRSKHRPHQGDPAIALRCSASRA